MTAQQRLNVHLPDPQMWNHIWLAARAQDMTISQWVRAAVREKLDRDNDK